MVSYLWLGGQRLMGAATVITGAPLPPTVTVALPDAVPVQFASSNPVAGDQTYVRGGMACPAAGRIAAQRHRAARADFLVLPRIRRHRRQARLPVDDGEGFHAARGDFQFFKKSREHGWVHRIDVDFVDAVDVRSRTWAAGFG